MALAGTQSMLFAGSGYDGAGRRGRPAARMPVVVVVVVEVEAESSTDPGLLQGTQAFGSQFRAQ